MKIKVVAYEGKIVVIPSNPTEGIGDKWYPTGKGRLGCVVEDTKSNLGVSKEAFELMRVVKRNHDAIGDIGWWPCDDKTWAFSWSGPIFRVIDPDTAEGDRDFRVTDSHWANCTEIPNDVPDEVKKAFTSDPDVIMWAEPHAILANMKPYGQQPGVRDTGDQRPTSGSRAPTPGGSYTMGPTEIKRVRRRLKKKARQSKA